MSYLFPYAGSERKPPMTMRKLAERPVDAAPPEPAPVQDNRPVELPAMPESLRKILIEVCAHHNAHPNDVIGLSCAARFVCARRHFVVRARNETEHSFPRIARVLRRDHTTAVSLFSGWRKEGDKTIAVWRPPVRETKPGPRRKTNRFELTAAEKKIKEMVERGMSFEEIAELRNIRVKSARDAYLDGLRKAKRQQEAGDELV